MAGLQRRAWPQRTAAATNGSSNKQQQQQQQEQQQEQEQEPRTATQRDPIVRALVDFHTW
ncbi:hypothetical protein AAL_07570 [Moelleriella libera RCEF 2490]|uniref:Uncharacterized protein n=1 Tax=Moelleriella libera RCEF 2490 TaxID=1081109 RepID=A0A167X631_9HYPO|nr:hypothetical protein AAL_07570 [Moelleriella libera RCEF 2490]